MILLTTGYLVAWLDVDDVNLNDRHVRKSIRDRLEINSRRRTVSELEREVGDTEQIAMMCRFGLPAGLSDKLFKSVRWLRLSQISQHEWAG